MPEENVERWRRGVDAWNRGALDEWLNETVTPGWELITGGAFPGLAPIYRGRQGALELWEALKNVVVRRWFWAFENDADAFRDTIHPEFEWFPIEENQTPFYGVEGAMRS